MSLHVLRNNCPYQLKIDSKVLVDDNISECDNLRPGDLRVSATQFQGYAPASFAQQG